VFDAGDGTTVLAASPFGVARERENVRESVRERERERDRERETERAERERE
jgi:hypothetical protein